MCVATNTSNELAIGPPTHGGGLDGSRATTYVAILRCIASKQCSTAMSARLCGKLGLSAERPLFSMGEPPAWVGDAS